MGNFRDIVYAGIIDKGNPYEGELEQGIAYDAYEVSHSVIKQDKNYPIILGGYQSSAQDLLRHFSAEHGSKILEIGSGTGIGTLELLLKNPSISVLCVEHSGGMIELARYKFYQGEIQAMFNLSHDLGLLDYWERFRLESEKYKDQVQFINSQFENVELPEQSIDYAIAFSSLYHTNLAITFKQLYKFLKNNRYIIWDGSSHFYDDEKFPSRKYGFRYNNFLGFVLEEVSKKVNIIGDYKELSLPKYNFDSLKKIASESGFNIEQIATYLTPVDLQIFIKNFVPSIIKSLIDPKSINEETDNIIKEGIAKAINNPKALEDTSHKYGIKAIFKSTKI